MCVCACVFVSPLQMKLLSKSVNSILDTQKIEMSQYMNLFYPATDWMLQIIAYRTPDSILVDFLEKCKNCKKFVFLLVFANLLLCYFDCVSL